MEKYCVKKIVLALTIASLKVFPLLGIPLMMQQMYLVFGE
jgi:hypothetical protein